MRLPKFSLKKCFILVVCFAILLFFVINLREKEIWNRSSQLNFLSTSNNINNLITNNHISYSNDNELTGKHSINVDIISQKSASSSPLNNDELNSQSQSQAEETNAESKDDQISDGTLANRPWYFTNGVRYPKPARISKKTNKRLAKLLPSEDPRSDRITNQLMFVPPNYEATKESGKLKTILLYNGLGPWNVKNGRDVFKSSKCPIDTCTITGNRDKASTADLILYKDHYLPTGISKHAKQIYMLYFLECPYHTQHVKFPDVFNWTATYRRDSDIVAPYEKWVYYDPRVHQIEQDRNYAQNKTKKVAWFVSNCSARNGRLQFAHDLQKYIDVDIYGACGNHKCSRSTQEKCFEILDRDYKFYLAFENSNCKDYISEKFYVNALTRNVLPIVMGARPEDYESGAPQKSYIHVDEFASPKELAEYLNLLDKNDDLYNSYFKWKGTGEFINTYFWCRVCSMIHDEEAVSKPKWYEDVNDWWRGQGTCTLGSWRSYHARKDTMSDD